MSPIYEPPKPPAPYVPKRRRPTRPDRSNEDNPLRKPTNPYRREKKPPPLEELRHECQRSARGLPRYTACTAS